MLLQINLVIRMEILAGTPIQRAIEEALDFAERQNINVAFNFNGVEMFLTPHSSLHEKLSMYDRELKRKSELKRHE